MLRLAYQLRNTVQLFDTSLKSLTNVDEITKRLAEKAQFRANKLENAFNPQPHATVVYFGEIHEQPRILASQMAIMSKLFTPTSKANQFLILEQFNVKQQHLISQYELGVINKEQLESLYESPHTTQTAASVSSNSATPAPVTSSSLPFVPEGHSLSHYGLLLDLAKELEVKAIGGFPPRGLARHMMLQGKEEGLAAALDCFPQIPSKQLSEMVQENKEIPKYPFFIEGTEEHYQHFVELMKDHIKPTENMTAEQRMRMFFDAQILKDSVMAAKIFSMAVQDPNKDSRILAIAGSGHIDYGFGVPERVRKLCQTYGVELDEMSVTTRLIEEQDEILKSDDDKPRPADLIFFFEEKSEEEDEE